MSGMISNYLMLAETTAAPFYQAGWFQFPVLLVSVGLIWFLAVKVAQAIRMPDYGGRLAVIAISLTLAMLVIGFIWPPKFGVDLRGGVNIIGQLNRIDDPDATDVFDDSQKITAEKIIPILKERVDPSGTKEIMLRALGTEKIEVTIPDVTLEEATEIWSRLAKTGKLQFRIAADKTFHTAATTLAAELARQGFTARTVKQDGRVIARWYNLAREVLEDGADADDLRPIKMVPEISQLVRDKKTGQLLDMREFSGMGKTFAEQLKARGIGTPQILMMEPESDKTDVQGKHLTAVASRRDDKGKPSVNFELNAEGAKRMQRLTTIHKKKDGKPYLLGIVLDNQVHSAPTIQSTIQSRGQITGNFSKQEIDDLIINLQSGKIDVALNNNPISKQFVASSLGKELKQKGLWSIGASFVLVLVFMIVYYRFAGIIASLALLLNLALIMALIMAIRQPLTLTGLAGLVLTVGMSVDANVLIFERIREELGRGAALRMAIRNGFDKATVTIVDANVTTLITALVLYVIGTEQIKGFAVTLILGILMSMFTAIYCSRTIFEIAERKRWVNKLNMTQIIGKQSFNFLSKRSIAFVVSAILIISGLVGMFSLGSRILDHDLRGGSTAQVVFQSEMTALDIEEKLNGLNLKHKDEPVNFRVIEITNPDMQNVFKIDTNLPSYDEDDADPSAERWKQLDEILAETFQGKLKLHHVDIGDVSVGSDSDSTENQTSSNTPGLWNYTLPSMLQSLSFGPAVILQDDGNAGEGTQEEESNQQDSEPQISGDEPQDGESVAPENQENPETTTEPDQPSIGAQDPPQSEAGNQAENDVVNVNGQVASFSLNFQYPMSGDGIKRFLIQSAIESMDTEIDESQIKVIPDQVEPDGTPESTRTRDWTVELQMSNAEAVGQLLTNWSSEFNQKPYFPVSGGVGGQIAEEARYQALAAILASLLGIIAYVWIRFQNVAFGLAAVIALVHDVLIVLGAIALSHYVAGALGFMLIDSFKISLPVVAALLTIIGYSLNDTIVVFDRIREVRGKRSEMNEEMINSSISQTLSRTILTSLTTFIVVFILYVFGGDAIHGFAFALTIGVIVGTYSSIFVASPALLWLMNRGFSPEYDENGNPIKKPA